MAVTLEECTGGRRPDGADQESPGKPSSLTYLGGRRSTMAWETSLDMELNAMD